MKECRVAKGDPVQFLRQYQSHVDMGKDGEYGIAIENERPDHSVMVELADGSTYLAKHIIAFAWSGWLPEELESVWDKYNQHNSDDFDDIYYSY